MLISLWTTFLTNRIRLILFRLPRVHVYRRAVGEVVRCISIPIIFASLLSSCSPAAAEVQIRPTPTPIVRTNQQSPLPTTNQNTVSLSRLNGWNAYDVNAIAWSRDSTKFALAGEKNNDGKFGVSVYDADASGPLWIRETYVPLDLTFTPDGQAIAVPFFWGTSFFDAATGQDVKKIEYRYHADMCFGETAINFSPDGKVILTLATSAAIGNESTEIYLWNVETNQCLGTFLKEQGLSFGFELSRDGQFLALALHDIPIQPDQDVFGQQIQIWNIGKQQMVCSFKDKNPIAITSDGRIVAASNVDNLGEVDLWNASSCQIIDKIQLNEQDTAYSLAFSPDGHLLAIGGSQTIQLRQVSSQKLLFESEKLQNHVDILAFSPDGKYLLSETSRASADDKGTVTLWEVSQ